MTAGYETQSGDAGQHLRGEAAAADTGTATEVDIELTCLSSGELTYPGGASQQVIIPATDGMS